MKNRHLSFLTSVGLAVLLCGPSLARAQSLGNAESYAVLGGSSVTVAGGGATITGDVGVSPGTSITGSPNVVAPFATHNNDGSAINAQSSTGSLYTTLAGMGGATAIGAELGGLTLTPGTYSFSSTANIAANQTLTLNGGGTYIFQVGSAITANVGSNVVLNGASACNVFWQVTSAATLNGNNFVGTVVAQAGVTLGVGASLTGRALTTSLGAVTLSGGNTIGGCSVAATPPPGCPPITLSPATLPSGRVAVAYSQTIVGNGGSAPYTFAVSAGSLPSGLTLTMAGVLAGTPTAASTSSFTIRATDLNGCIGTLPYTLTILAALPPPAVCPPITLSPATLPSGRVAVAYSQTISGNGGTAPYTFGVTSGSLPAGLTLTPAGVLAGTPTAAGTSTFTIRGTDANGCFTEISRSVVIAAALPPPAGCPPITLTPVTVPNGQVGLAYSQTIVGNGGTAPYSFGVTAGTLPPGLTLTPTGELAGTPTTGGTSTFTIRGTDANGCFTELPYIIAIGITEVPPPVAPPAPPPVPTLPQAFLILLALGLAWVGYSRLLRRVRAE